jgi:NAD(P)-dependent dehydrogenase (short-subunit alcohol dehydrogenase family)
LDKSETMAEKKEEKTAVVTGSASGIGFETSLLLAKKGFRTYATVRDLDKATAIKEISDKHELPITVVELDVTSDKSVSDAIDKIVNEDNKRIDVLVNNAAYGQGGALEDDSMDEIKSLFETNLFWCHKGNEGSASHYEKTARRRNNSKHNLNGR